MHYLKNIFFMTTVLLTSVVIGMDEPPKIIFNLGDLPAEMLYKILKRFPQIDNAKTLEEATTTIRSLYLADATLNAILQDKKLCLLLVKNISQKFSCSNAQVCRFLKIAPLCPMQKTFEDLCDKPSLSPADEVIFYELLEQGLDLEFTTDSFQGNIITPLVQCIFSRNLPLVTILLQQKANPNKPTSNGILPLQMAIVYAAHGINITILNELVKYADLNQYNIQGTTPLIYCISSRKPELVKILLDAGADPEFPAKNKTTPLQLAQNINNQEMINLIQEAINKKFLKR
jgi:hypothetical protein